MEMFQVLVKNTNDRFILHCFEVSVTQLQLTTFLDDGFVILGLILARATPIVGGRFFILVSIVLYTTTVYSS